MLKKCLCKVLWYLYKWKIVLSIDYTNIRRWFDCASKHIVHSCEI